VAEEGRERQTEIIIYSIGLANFKVFFLSYLRERMTENEEGRQRVAENEVAEKEDGRQRVAEAENEDGRQRIAERDGRQTDRGYCR